MQAKPGYLLDDSPQVITIKDHQTYVLELFNQPKGNLVVVKKDSQTGEPLAGVEFKVTTASGEFVPNNEGQTSSNGIYRTDENGEFVINKLKPGAYTVTETKTLDNYVLDAPPQTVVIEANDMQVLTFTNTKKGCLIIKKIDSVTHEPLAGVRFEIKGCNGNPYPEGSFTTDSNGVIRIDHLPSGDYAVTETQAKDGYRLDNTVHTVNIEAGKTKEVTFDNEPLGGLVIKKMDSKTKEPLSDVLFKITRSDGTVFGASNGEYRTDEQGFILVPDIQPGSYVIQEVQAKPGYLIDNTPKTIDIKDHRTYTIEFFNQPKGALVVVKKDSQTGEPLAGVEFKVTTANGEFVPNNEGQTSTNGIYRTDENGEFVINKLKPGAYTVTETRTLEDYILDAPPQTVVIEANDMQVLTFTNTKKGCLIIKKIDSVTHEPLAGVRFEIKGCNGNPYPEGSFTTDSNGVIRIDHLPSGDYAVTETQAKDGYRLDNTVHTLNIEAGKTKEVTFDNEPLGGLIVKKMDSKTKEPLSDVLFKITRSDGTVFGESNGEYRTDEQGFISIPDIQPGSYVIQEVQAKPGYLIDSTPKTIEIKNHRTYMVEFFNQPKGALVVVKKDAQTGEPLEGVEFKITTANGELVPNNGGMTSTNGIYRTNTDGEIVIEQLKPGAYLVTETRTLEDYILDAPPQTVVVEANDMQVLTFTNTKKGCLLIEKVDSVTKKPLAGVKFEIKGCNGNAYKGGEFTTDGNGVIQLDHLPSGDYTVVERQTKEGYHLDSTVQTVNVEAGKTRKLTFENDPLGGLLLKKMDSKSKEPLSDVIFRIGHADGTTVGTTNSEFRTDEQGYISLPNLEPGSYIITELQAKPGYLLDDSPKNITIKDHQTYVLEVFNAPKGGLLIVKKDSQTGEALAGVEFKVTTANGELVADNEGMTSTNGIYVTDEAGQIEISQLKLGTYTVTEMCTLDDYVLDAAPQTVVVEANDLQTLTFTNTKKGCLIIKKIDSVTREPIDGVKFKIQGCNGNPYPEGEYTTDVNGVIRLDHLPDGDYTVAEVQAKDGYRLDNTVKTIKMEAGKTQEITFENEPLGGLLIRKMDASTKEPISEVVFKITTSDGTVVGNSNGEYQTDAQGYISLPDLEPGSYVISEMKAKTGYLLDSTPKTVEIKDHRLYTLDFYNQPLGGLIVQKLDSVTKKPLQGVQFKITTADGTFVPANDGKTSSNGLYFTDENGQIVLPGLAPNTYIVSEVQTIDGYTIDEASRSQTVVVNTDDTQTLYFYNAPAGGLELIKVNEANQSERIPNVTFEIRKMDGGLVKTIVTDTNGRVHASLDAGDYYAVEIKAGEGFKIDSTPHYFTVKDGETTTLTITNKRFSGILLHKIDSVTGKGIYGVTFLMYDGNHNPIDQFTTDQDGYAYT